MLQTLGKKLFPIGLLFLFLWFGTRYFLPILLPFLLAWLLAAAAEPLVHFLQNRVHIPRTAAAGIGISISLTLVILSILCVSAILLRELGMLAGIVPDLEGTALQGMDSLEHFLLQLASRTPAGVQPILIHGVENIFSDGNDLLDQATSKLLGIASGLVKALPGSALSLGTWVLASFMISAKLPFIRAWIAKQLPPSWHQKYLPALQTIKKSLAGWILAQAKLMGITLCVLTVGFVALQIPYGPLWALLISLVDALPVLGTGTVLIPWSLVCFLQGNTPQAIGLLGTYIAATVLRSVLEPKLVGKQLGLDPLVTLVSIYAGYRIWGIGGMLLSPLLAVTATQLVTFPQQKA